MEVTRYHKFLRSSLVVVTLMLVFDSGALSPFTKQLSDTTLSYVANVGSGMYASVPSNELNTLSAQLRAEQESLNAREALLNEREISARNFDTERADYSTYILSIILFILTSLVILNYAMDFNRARRTYYESTAH